MNALNEVNKVITSVSYYTHRHSQLDDDEWLTAEKMAVSKSTARDLFPYFFSQILSTPSKISNW